MSDISQPRVPEFLGLTVAVLLISLLAGCAKDKMEFDWRLVSNIKKGIEAPHSGYFEWANEKSWYSGFYGNASETRKEQVSKRETIVCRPEFAGAFKSNDGPVPASDIVTAFQSRQAFRSGFSLDFQDGNFRFSQFDYELNRYYLVSYGWGSKCKREHFWYRTPTERAARFCDKEGQHMLLTDAGFLIADFFPLTASTARFSSQIVA
jgi:hypothetical protein